MQNKSNIGWQTALLLLILMVLPGCQGEPLAESATPTTPTDSQASASLRLPGFITVQDGRFLLQSQPYRFVGTNFWQGMNLGVAGPEGDRARLIVELDRMQAIGITNLRIMAASEGPDTEPYRLAPALMVSPGNYNQSVLDGLDFLLAEMNKRDMRAVMVLNNFWQWSGGMAQYVSWSEGSAIPYPGDWGNFMRYSAKFYACEECQIWYRNHIDMLIQHTNPYTGLQYKNDATIFSWELANEPRRYPQTWIDETAAYIKSLDPNHLVTTGSEGEPPGERQNFAQTHAGADIDYLTVHIWPQNWGWYNPAKPATYDQAESRARLYLQAHLSDAAALGKPLVLEEFGLARDWEPLHDIYDPESPTNYRDQFYAAMFEEIAAAAAAGGLAAGDNFWAWAGSARPGDGLTGDPPHETPGWYSVYNTDESTITIIAAHVEEMAQIKK